MIAKITSIVPAILMMGTELSASELSFYFSNDSLNGFQLSDAYETHDMGIKYESTSHWFDLNLGIVSPDMYVYRNQYRDANRSYGEIISFTYGDTQTGGFCKFTRVGKFGLDKAQDFAHSVFQLQPVSEINDLVRMPDTSHFGCGIKDLQIFDTISVAAYLGTDRSFLASDIRAYAYQNTKFNLSSNFGLSVVGHDNIVSAPPISAKFRNVSPHMIINLDYHLNDVTTLSFSERLSLPTIESDDKLFIQFFAGIRFNIK